MASALLVVWLTACARPAAPPPDDPAELVNYLTFEPSPQRTPVTSLDAARWLAAQRPGSPRLVRRLGADRAGAEATRQSAEMFLQHGWTLRGHPTIRHDEPIAWHVSPKGDRNWHYKLNALLFAEPLLLAHAQTGHQRYYDVALRLMLHWIDENMPPPARLPGRPRRVGDERELEEPPPLPSHKMRWYDMATANRSLWLSYFLRHELRRPVPDSLLLATLVRAMNEHAVRRLKGKRILTNHGMYSAAGIRAAVVDLHGLPEREEMMAESGDWLRRSLERQFSARFVHLEDTPIYQLNIVSSVRGLAYLEMFDDVPLLSDIAEEGYALCPWLFHPNGDMVQVGDGSQRDLAGPDAMMSFLGSEGATGKAPALVDWGFEQAGVAIYRTPWRLRPFSEHSYLYFIASNTGSGHSHADFGTFEWSSRGVPVVVNSGGYSYQHNSWRRFFKSTRAGSAVEVDARSFEKTLGRKRGFSGVGLRAWGKLSPTRPWVAARFEHRARKLDHARTLVADDAGWLLVVDDVRSTSAAPRTFKQWFQLHEEIDEVRVDDKNASVVGRLPDGRRLFITPLDGVVNAEIVRGRVKGGIQGWISRRYLEKTPRASVGLQREGSRATYVTLVSASDAAPTELFVRPADDALGLSWRDADGKLVRLGLERREGIWRPTGKEG